MADSALTAFQQEILRGIAMLEDPSGLEIIDWMEENTDYSDINHGRYYPNVDQLVEMSLVVKGSKDDRTNEYTLTRRGRNEVTELYSRWGRAAEEVESSVSRETVTQWSQQ